MIGLTAIAIVVGSTDGNRVAVAGERDGSAAGINSGFSVDVSAALHPGVAIPVVDACMTFRPIMLISSNGNGVAIVGERNGIPATVTLVFPIDVTA